MEYLTDIERKFQFPTAVTIGKFDGLHLGHRLLIDKVKLKSERGNYKSAAFSFYPPPLRVLKGDNFATTIFTRQEKKALLEEIGVDVYLEYPFTKDFAAIEPESFVNEILLDKMNCRYLAVGANYRFGKNHAGTPELMRDIAASRGALVEIVPEVLLDGAIVSSSGIRALLAEGQVLKAAELLSKPYFVAGIVARGKKLGRTLGFPTANILPDEEKFLPKKGVYLTKVYYNGNWYHSITNVGNNPTVGGLIQTVETYLLDFQKSIYGEEIKVEFIDRIRGEIKFSREEELREQIRKDVLHAKSYFTSKAGRCK